MEITFNQIKPYLRFVRYMTIDSDLIYFPSVPYDARLFYTTDGSGIIEAGGIEYPMQKNSLIIINSGVEYHIKSSEKTVTYLSVNFDFTYGQVNQKTPIPPDFVKNYNSKKLINHVTFCDTVELNEVFYIKEMPAIEKKLVSMEKEYARKISMHELKLSADMIDVIINCLRFTTSQSMVENEKEVAAKIVNYLQENYSRNLTNKQIAKLFNYHPNYISNLIKKHTGLPLHQYIKNIRITKAADMLTVTDKCIGEVALECGFYDASHFIKSFKEIIGMTPMQYQNNYQ